MGERPGIPPRRVALRGGTVVNSGEALLCTACDDDVEADGLWAPGGPMERHCAGSEYVADWMSRSLRPLWPPPAAALLPAPGYLRLCAEAHLRAGLLDHFLDSTLLNDRETTLRAFCARDPGTRALVESLGDDVGGGADSDSDAMSANL